jgi:hypothetical protein
MKRIQIFRVNKLSSKATIIFGLLLFTFGLTGIVMTVNKGFNMKLFGDWIYLLHIAQGLFFMKWGFSQLKLRQYFIEWDDHKLRYLIPGNLQETELAFEDIGSVNIGFFKIIIKLKDGEDKIIALKDIQTKELNQIKHKFRKLGDSFRPGQ